LNALVNEPVPTRSAGYALFGIFLPLVAFFFDLALHVDPILWSGPAFFNARTLPEDIGPRQVLVYALLGLALVGMTLHLVMPTTSARWNAIRIALLANGVLFSAIHSLVFLPLIPLSAFAIIAAGIGLLGFAPYFCLVAFSKALGAAIREQRALGRPTWQPVLLGFLPAILAVLPFAWIHLCLSEVPSGPPAVTRLFRSLGPTVHLAPEELASVYGRLDGASQVRFRALFMKTFGRDVQQEERGRRGWR
jgi:hypothetical protein